MEDSREQKLISQGFQPYGKYRGREHVRRELGKISNFDDPTEARVIPTGEVAIGGDEYYKIYIR